MAPKRSPSIVWQYFSKIDSNSAECKKCGKIIKTCGGTSNMAWHYNTHGIRIRLRANDTKLKTQKNITTLAFSEMKAISKAEATPPTTDKNDANSVYMFSRAITVDQNEESNYETPHSLVDSENDEYLSQPVDSDIDFSTSWMGPNLTKRPNTAEEFSPLESVLLNTLQNLTKIEKSSGDEFDFFCKSLAIQLRKMPLERAIACQQKLQAVIIEERLEQLSSASSSNTNHNYQL